MRLFIFGCIVLSVSGCAAFVDARGHAPVGLGRHEVPSAGRGANIAIIESEHVDRPMEVLGFVDVHEPVTTQAEAIAELREHAAELGAEAVIGVELHHGEGGPAPSHLSGTAVRFRDLIRGRSYDVLGELDVNAPMGHEDDANRELGRRALALGADLITNVKFDHGEGEGPLRVTGTAIRFRRAAAF